MERPAQITNDHEWRASCSEIVRVARGILDHSMGVVAGARLLSALCFRVSAENDPDFLTFTGIDSDTDRFPLGEVRSRWSSEALARYDDERLTAEAHWRKYAEGACTNLIQKYGVAG